MQEKTQQTVSLYFPSVRPAEIPDRYSTRKKKVSEILLHLKELGGRNRLNIDLAQTRERAVPQTNEIVDLVTGQKCFIEPRTGR